ncbi:MAG: DUF6328 family protein [Pseudomonadota bacterium]
MALDSMGRIWVTKKVVRLMDSLVKQTDHSNCDEADASTTLTTDAAGHTQEDGDLTDMLGELRVLLPTAQLLSAFLITVPFTAGFGAIIASEKRVFLATFLFSIASLVLLSGPAVQHRLIRPLINRARFKHLATLQIVLGAATLTFALVLATQLVLSSVLGHTIGNIAAAAVAVLIVMLWWVCPKLWRAGGHC